MVAEKRFSMRLACGREASFDTAAELVAWMERTRSPRTRARRERRSVRRRSLPTNSQSHQAPPLARFRQN